MKKYIILSLIILLPLILGGCPNESDDNTYKNTDVEFVKVEAESLSSTYYFDIEIYNSGGDGEYYIEFYGKEGSINPDWELITDTKNYQIGSETKQKFKFEYKDNKEYYDNKLILYTQTPEGPKKTDEIEVEIDNP